MIVTDKRFVAGEDDDLIPVVLFQGNCASMDVPFLAIARFSPRDIIAMDNDNFSILRQEVARTIPIAIRSRKLSSRS